MNNSKPIKQEYYQIYADCMRSDQVSHQDIAALMNDKGFSEWYKSKYLSRLQDEQEQPYVGDNTKRKVKYTPGMISCAGVEHIDTETEEFEFSEDIRIKRNKKG